MPLLYDIGLALYHTGIRVVAPFNAKAKAWVKGREGTWARLEAKRNELQGCLWMHCASVGEFEQGRPVLEALKKQRPEMPVLITFFSPSGYEARKLLGSARSDSLVTHVEYLPADGAVNAARLLDLVRPKAVLWVKYEFWYHWLRAIAQRKIPLFLVSAIFRNGQPFFKWYGGTHRSMLKCFTQLFVQDEASYALLTSIGVDNVIVSGDTRFDRVAQIAAANVDLPIASAFKGEHPLLIAGSTWPEDEALLLSTFAEMDSAPKCIVVPHELDAQHLQSIENSFPKPLARWSEVESTTAENIAHTLGGQATATLLVDRMGLLAQLYRYADVVYVGGGFGDGIHSLLEAAAWGKPVIFGPRHHKFAEAMGLIEAGCGFEVYEPSQLCILLMTLSDEQLCRSVSMAAATYVNERTGATDRIVAAITPRLG